MLKNLNLDEFQKLGHHNMDAAMKVLGEWNKGWQAIEIQSGFAKRTYDGYMHQLSKIGGMYAELAKEAYKPVEKALHGAR